MPGASLDPAEVTSVGFTIADKKPGPFELEIASVKAVAGDDPTYTASARQTVVDVAAAAGSFKTLLDAATAAGLAGVLSGEGPFTVFAPTDEAFARLPAGTLDELRKPANKEKLAGILLYHVVAGRVTLAKAIEAREAVTLQGTEITAMFDNGRVRIGPATLLKADIVASNGIIHVIDQVLLPPETVGKPLPPRALVEMAIDRGVPLFNGGQVAACAAVYEITCEALRAMPEVSEASRKDLERALRAMRAEKSAREKAWILRRALDRILAHD
ncbi:MAG: fasciclin domain-containing protein [Acidobacteria bacterium]|nr:fasciclin domain-containing protein [Acidobacteriota bacterium]